MGEIAEMMLDGTMCQGCGEWLRDGDDGPGYPGYCYFCRREERRSQEKRQAESAKAADMAAKNTVAHVETIFEALFDPGVAEHFRKQIYGMVRGMYVSDHGVITHDGMRMTIQNNLEAQRRAEKRKAKQAARANV